MVEALRGLTVLLVDLDRARHAMEQSYEIVAAEVRERGQPLVDPRSLAYLAVTLSQYYNALEDLLERCARIFEGPPSGGDAWHTELLRRAALDLPALRPAIVPPAALGDAFELLKFRHFLRHAYAVKLEAEKLGLVTAALDRLHPLLQASLAELRTFFAALLADTA